jgi:hypothetical protein
MRVQRNHSSPSALRSPLTRHPLGDLMVRLAVGAMDAASTGTRSRSRRVRHPTTLGASRPQWKGMSNPTSVPSNMHTPRTRSSPSALLRDGAVDGGNAQAFRSG